MSPPNKLYSSIDPDYVYDDVAGVCRPVEPSDAAAVCYADTPVQSTVAPADTFTAGISRSQLLRDAAFSSPRGNSLFGSPESYSLLALLPSLQGCSGPPQPPPAGDPIDSATPLSAELVMNSAPITGNLDGVELAGNGSQTAVAWSDFDSTTPANTGTFAFLRSGTSGGSQFTASNDASARHLTTSATVLEDGSAVAAFTKATGDGEPSSIIARRISATGSPVGGDIAILPPQIRDSFPDARLVSLSNGFVAVYRDGAGHLTAASFDNNGNSTGTLDLGSAPAQRNHYVINRGEGDTWVLAELSGSNQVHVRSFSGLNPGSIDQNISTSGFSSTVNLSVAINEEGAVMAAWNSQGGGISGAVVNGPSSGEPFNITSSGLANTMSLANDHHGNFFFAWEQGGQVLARVYNGTSAFTTPADFSVIGSGNHNSNVQAYVSDDGTFTITWVRSTTSGGNTVQDLLRRDYRINYSAH